MHRHRRGGERQDTATASSAICGGCSSIQLPDKFLKAEILSSAWNREKMEPERKSREAVNILAQDVYHIPYIEHCMYFIRPIESFELKTYWTYVQEARSILFLRLPHYGSSIFHRWGCLDRRAKSSFRFHCIPCAPREKFLNNWQDIAGRSGTNIYISITPSHLKQGGRKPIKTLSRTPSFGPAGGGQGSPAQLAKARQHRSQGRRPDEQAHPEFNLKERK